MDKPKIDFANWNWGEGVGSLGQKIGEAAAQVVVDALVEDFNEGRCTQVDGPEMTAAVVFWDGELIFKFDLEASILEEIEHLEGETELLCNFAAKLRELADRAESASKG